MNRRSATWLIPLLFLISFPLWKHPVASFLTPRGLNQQPDQTKQEEHGKLSHDFVMNKVTILQSQSGKRTAVIKAHKGFSNTEADSLSLTQVNADLTDKQGKLTNVIADLGTYTIETKKLSLRENVVVTRLEGQQKMTTDYLIYSDQEGKVTSPGPTNFSGKGFQVTSGRMEYNVIDGSYVLSDRVHCLLDESIGSS